MNIPFFGIDRQYSSIKEEILDATDTVLKSGQVLDGINTKLFETAIARRCNRSYAISVNSGTQALIFAQLAALNKPPYSILIPTISFVATINSVLMNNHTPVFCDIDHKGLMDLSSIDFKLDRSIGAIMYVNLFGNCIDWDKFRMYTEFFNDDIIIIEDAAQSFGASYKGIPSGSMGDVSILSFDPTKNLNNYGSGGMILTDDFNIYEICRNLKNNGKILNHSIPGTNSKMSEVDCSQMLVKLKYFDSWQRRRKEIADYYINELYQYVDILLPNENVEHAWHKFVIRYDNRHGLQQHLELNGIETKIHYETALIDHDVGYIHRNYTESFYEETAQFAKECLSLPIYPELLDSEVETIVEKIKQYID
jgi:dTDP-4-amino-4,6-dideoxygalactose transaminase